MKHIYLFCIFVIWLDSSCVSHKPVAIGTQPVHDGALRVTPSWQSKRTFWSKAWPFIVGPLAGATYFGVRQNADPQFYTNSKTKTSYSVGVAAAIGGGLGFVFPGYIPFSFLRQKSVRPRIYQSSDEARWVSDYGNYVVREREPNGRLLLIPRNQVANFDRTEQEMLEKAKRERREAEERARQAEIAREDSAYQNVLNRGAWQAYLDKFPNGRYINEVKRLAEPVAYVRVVTSGYGETYLKYFPTGEHNQAVRQVQDECRRVNSLAVMDWDASTLEAYNQIAETGRQLQKDLIEKLTKTPESEPHVRQILSGLIKTVDDRIASANKWVIKKQLERDRKLQQAKEWVVGESLCWTTSSVRLDENGKEVKGTSAKMDVRVVIEEINPEHNRFKIRIKELFSHRTNKNVDSFRMATANRIWQLEEIDWLDPTSEEFDFNKCQ